MPYLNQNGKIVEVTQAQFDQYTVDNNINPELTNAARALAGQPPLAPAGGTVLNSNSVTTPILTPNTTNTSPGQTLAASSVTVISAPASFNNAVPIQASLTANETVVPVSTSTTVPFSDSGFVETSPGVFQAAADLHLGRF